MIMQLMRYLNEIFECIHIVTIYDTPTCITIRVMTGENYIDGASITACVLCKRKSIERFR
jgi:hypothetical protein